MLTIPQAHRKGKTMFYIAKEQELTKELLCKIINKYKQEVLPKLQKWHDYEEGIHKIVKEKAYADADKPCNKIVTNFCKVITKTYAGYIVGRPVAYTSNNDITDIQEVINYNDDDAANMQWLTNALIYGVGYELQWLDKEAKNRYSQISPLNGFPIYDNTLDSELLYFVRWYDADNIDDDKNYIIEVYSAASKVVYKADGFGGSLTLLSEEPHYFKDVPVSVFWLGEDGENIFNSIIPLQDSYNDLQSSEVDDFMAWVDAYLTLQGVDADPADIAEMKRNRTLVLPEGATANWLIKNASDTQIVNMLDNFKENIFKITSCPDMADENFLAQSGTALAYKLVGFENVASGIVARFTKAIQRRIELICNVLNLKASEAIWRDVKISFVRNLPTDITTTINLVNSLKGIVSDKTLLSQIPFIDDVEEELEAMEQQKKRNMELYSFNMTPETDEDNEGEEE